MATSRRRERPARSADSRRAADLRLDPAARAEPDAAAAAPWAPTGIFQQAIDALVRRFVIDLTALVARAATWRPSLDAPPRGMENAAGMPPRGLDGAGRPRKRVRRRAASLELLAGRVADIVAAGGQHSVSQLARAAGVTPRELSRPITWLLARGTIVRSGERRGTRYTAPRSAAQPAARKPRRIEVEKKKKKPRSIRPRTAKAKPGKPGTRRRPKGRPGSARRSR